MSTKTCTQLNTEFGIDDDTEQFKLHTTDTYKRKRIIIRIKLYKKESSIDILTQYTIFLNTSCFFFWLLGFLNFTVKTTSSSHSFVFWNRYPFSLPISFQLWNLTVFCWFLSFCSDSAAIQTNQCLFVFFAKNFPASASKSRCEVSRPRAIGEYQYRGSFVGARLCNWGTS